MCLLFKTSKLALVTNVTMETEFSEIKKNEKVKLWRVMPLIFLIFFKN